MELRPYQIEIAKKGAKILNDLNILALFMEVRTGKSLTAMEVAKLTNKENVLFITKIKAFSSIQKDYDVMGYDFRLTIINRESMHKLPLEDYDLVIIDEVHGYSSFPKPSKYAKYIKENFGDIDMIFLSGTPSPESYSQFYHIFWLSDESPFNDYKNFYKWAYDFVNVKIKHLGYAQVKDYSDARYDDFKYFIEPYIITFTQEQAGFITDVKENVLFCKMKDLTYQIIDRLKKDLVIKSQDGRKVIADTGAKLQQKIHQLSSGTIIFEDGTSKIVDDSKALFIKEKFNGKKIGIFYKFKEELNLLKSIFKDNLTTDLDEFNSTNKNIALQIVSGREGISLKKADYIVFFNIDFSAVSYFQAKDRMTTMDRNENTVYWIFSDKGIEQHIYKAVTNKKNYTLSLFQKDYDISTKNNKRIRG